MDWDYHNKKEVWFKITSKQLIAIKLKQKLINKICATINLHRQQLNVCHTYSVRTSVKLMHNSKHQKKIAVKHPKHVHIYFSKHAYFCTVFTLENTYFCDYTVHDCWGVYLLPARTNSLLFSRFLNAQMTWKFNYVFPSHWCYMIMLFYFKRPDEAKYKRLSGSDLSTHCLHSGHIMIMDLISLLKIIMGKRQCKVKHYCICYDVKSSSM